MAHTTFLIEPLSRFAASSTSIRRPREIACFSYDDNHNFSLGDTSLRYYYPPKLPADLSCGFDTFQRLDDSADEHLDALLETIVSLEKETGKKCEADVVTWRGIMTKILTTPFDALNSFEMNATRFQGTIFIEEDNEYKNKLKLRQRSQRMPPGMPSQDLMAYWGYKFETLSLLRQPWDQVTREEIESREELVVRNSTQYCSVVRTGIGSSRLVIGGEVDAIWDCKPEGKEDPIHWVELKTSAEPRQSRRDELRYERKLLKFWAQSFLLGVPKIVVGFRDQNGIVHRLEELETASIPGHVKRFGQASWDGNACINFAATFLEWLNQTISNDGTWKIRRSVRSPAIELFKVEEHGTGNILSETFSSWRLKE